MSSEVEKFELERRNCLFEAKLVGYGKGYLKDRRNSLT